MLCCAVYCTDTACAVCAGVCACDWLTAAAVLLSHCWWRQTKGAVCTGLKDAAAEVHNFPLAPQDEAEWAKVRCSCCCSSSSWHMRCKSWAVIEHCS